MARFDQITFVELDIGKQTGFDFESGFTYVVSFSIPFDPGS